MDTNQVETKTTLPAGFLLGAAAAAHQVEGNNMNSDWWMEEHAGKLPKSGLACDHYNRYDEDFQIAKDIGLNSFRISIEWSRIEPVENQWDKVAIEHYRKVLKKMKELGLTRMVTLHHFTLPVWLYEQGGFETHKGAEAFARYAWFVAQNLGDEIDLWCTINEPTVYSTCGYIIGKWPPFKKKNYFKFYVVYKNLIKAHKSAYEAIKQVIPTAQIGVAHNATYIEPNPRNLINTIAAKIAVYFNNMHFLSRISKHMDWVGLNYYFYHSFTVTWKGIKITTKELPKSEMGWAIFPEGIYHVLTNLKKFDKPIYITENGIANARDDMRKDFIRQNLGWALRARDEGVDVRGYFYWSLTDNYEWSDGFDRYFGLVEINYETQERKIRPSAEVIKEIIGN